jgi:hypothetical protein
MFIEYSVHVPVTVEYTSSQVHVKGTSVIPDTFQESSIYTLGAKPFDELVVVYLTGDSPGSDN